MPARLSREEYIKRATEAHNGKYDYSLLPEKISQKTKVKIICPVHGIFEQNMGNHANNGLGCKKCGIEKRAAEEKANTGRKYKDEVIRLHPELDFTNAPFAEGFDNAMVGVKCRLCGADVTSTIQYLLHHPGSGCKKCKYSRDNKNGYYGRNKEKQQKKFISEAKRIHGTKYDYSKVVYEKFNIPVEIVCKKHGSFFKRPCDHIYGGKEQGCPYCTEEDTMSTFERKTFNYLIEKNENFIFQYRVLDNEELRRFPFDFFIKRLNLLVEVQGLQHFENCWNMSEKDFQRRLEIDKLKEKLSKEIGYNFLALDTRKKNWINDLKEYLERFNDYPIGEAVNSQQE